MTNRKPSNHEQDETDETLTLPALLDGIMTAEEQDKIYNSEGQYNLYFIAGERTEFPGISYGNAIEINADNIKDLGLDLHPNLYRMNIDGEFYNDPSDWTASFQSYNNEHLLAILGSHEDDGKRSYTRNEDGTITVTGHEDAKLMLQRVEVDGVTQGYFISQPGAGGGNYLTPDAIDYAGLPEEMRAELEKPESLEALETSPEMEPQDPAAESSYKIEDYQPSPFEPKMAG